MNPFLTHSPNDVNIFFIFHAPQMLEGVFYIADPLRIFL